MTERSLVLVKPDGVRRGLVGEVLRRVEAKGYTLVALDLRVPARELLAEHYAEHEGKPFYEPLVEFMMSGPVAAAVIEGQRCIEVLAARDGRAALAIVGERGGDIALLATDVMMPDMSGPELVAAVRARWPALRVIYISGHTSDAVVQEGVAASAVSFLPKPHTPLQLAQLVRVVLDAADSVPQ